MTIRDVEYETTTVEELVICDDCGLAVSDDDLVTYRTREPDFPEVHLHGRCVDNVTLSDDATIANPSLRDMDLGDRTDLPVVLALDRVDVGAGILGMFALAGSVAADGLLASVFAISFALVMFLIVAGAGTEKATQAADELLGGDRS